MLKKNDDIKLTVRSCTLQGSGVCDYNGMTVFVRGTVTGDHIIAHIIKVKKTYAVGIIKEITQKSPMRTKPECPVCEKCGGCSFGQIKYSDELAIKYQQVCDNFQRIGKSDVNIDKIIPSVSTYHYRNKAQYPVGFDGNFAQIGFYAPMTHRIIDCLDCKLQPEEFADITNVFRDLVREKKISVYNGQTGKGMLRHIYIRKAVVTNEIMVCIVANGSKLENSEYIISSLLECNSNIKSIILNVNTQKTNVVLGQKCITLFGKDYITDELCKLKFNISPLSFYQVNHDTAEILYEKAKEFAELTGSETLLDIYCGTGTIGLTMADRVKKLIGIEIIEQAVINARENAKLNSIENAEFICGDASEVADKLKDKNIHADVVILDPPRKGCDEQLIDTVVKINPDRIVYVSCDSATQARDCAIFNSKGYKTVKAVPVDMFPRTGNSECVVKMIRR